MSTVKITIEGNIEDIEKVATQIRVILNVVEVSNVVSKSSHKPSYKFLTVMPINIVKANEYGK